MLTIALDIPEQYRKKAEYVFRCFSQIWGLPIRFCERGEPVAHIRYAATKTTARSGERTVIIPWDEDLFKKQTACTLTHKGSYHVWSKDSDPTNVDLVASSYRLLTLQDEFHVPRAARDSRGAFVVGDLPLHRRMASDIPLVDSHAQQLLANILRSYPELRDQISCRWPNGASYAVCLTHDTDAVNVAAPKEMLKNAANLILKRNGAYFTLFKQGVRTAFNLQQSPLLGFPSWMDFESDINIRSCFYLFLDTPGARAHLHDCKSTAMDGKVDWDVLRTMARSGWEFGFHAPINSGQEPDSFAHGRRLLERKLSTEIAGLRHHWFALDWNNPNNTFRGHIEAGYQYDSSLAWWGAPGFRAATSFPFRPFDTDLDRPLPIYELPTCLTDGHIMSHDGDLFDALAKGLETLRMVKRFGGVAVLNWHTESICNQLLWKNSFTLLRYLLAPCLAAGDAWFATPTQIMRHWDNRAQQLGLCPA